MGCGQGQGHNQGEGCVGLTFVQVFFPVTATVYFRIVQLLSWEKQKTITLFPASRGGWLLCSVLSSVPPPILGALVDTLERKVKKPPVIRVFQSYYNNL